MLYSSVAILGREGVERELKVKGLVAGCHSFCLFFIFYNIHTFNHIHKIHPSPFAEASLHASPHRL
jgi:hypothetical protein